MIAKARCEICGTRPIMTAAQKRERGVDFPYCLPCLTLADWENVHSDDAHGYGPDDELPNDCWICFPELDETTENYVQRNGTSRQGMTIHAKGSAKEKAALVSFAVEGTGRGSAKVSTRKGITTLKGLVGDVEIRLAWELDRYVGGTFAGRKVRNVSEALRLVAAAK